MKVRQEPLSRKAGGRAGSGRASLWAKQLKEDVSEDSDAGRQPVQRGFSLKLASSAT